MHDREKWWEQPWGQGKEAPATAQGRLRALEEFHVERAKDRAPWSFFGIIFSGSP